MFRLLPCLLFPARIFAFFYRALRDLLHNTRLILSLSLSDLRILSLRSLQLGSMTSCSGFPVCLSGIQIFPQRHQPMRQQARSRVQSRPPMPPTAPLCLPDDESAGSECESTSPSTTPTTGLMHDNGGSHEGSSSELYTNTSDWPRLSLVQQMADLDCRREAVRRQSSQNNGYLMDYRLSLWRNDIMSACLKGQFKEDDESPCIPRSACAKAA